MLLDPWILNPCPLTLFIILRLFEDDPRIERHRALFHHHERVHIQLLDLGEIGHEAREIHDGVGDGVDVGRRFSARAAQEPAVLISFTMARASCRATGTILKATSFSTST